MYKLVFFVPESHAEAVKEALFAVGAGQYRNYDRCTWESRGTGQFRPLEGSSAYIGTVGETERVVELRVELVCRDGLVRDALRALIDAHPYEEPAYEAYAVYDIESLPTELA